MHSQRTSEPSPVRPATDIFETGDSLILVADIPGASTASVELRFENDVLLLRARVERAVPEGWQPLGAEFELADYERAFRLTTEVESEAITATLQDGRLRVLMPKRRRKPAPIRVLGA